MKSGGMSPRSPETQEAFDRIEQMERNMEKRLQEATMRMSQRQDEVVKQDPKKKSEAACIIS